MNKFADVRSEALYRAVPQDTVGSSSEGIGWAGLYPVVGLYGGWILNEDVEGFVACKFFPNDDELNAAWKEICSNLEFSGEPDEDDYVIEDHPQGYTMKDVIYNSMDEAIAQVKEWMDQEQFFPNVWFINDHGNINPVELSEYPSE